MMRVSGAANLPLADEDHAWDADAARQRMWERADGDWDAYGDGFVLSDGSDTREGFKLPFADVIDGELKAVPRGVFAAAGVLQGARGGMQGGGEEAARRFLVRYYKRMKRPAPWDQQTQHGAAGIAPGAALAASRPPRPRSTTLVETFYDGIEAECFDNVGRVRATFTDVPGLPSPAVERDAELFCVGTHKKRAYSAEDLRQVVAAFSPPADEEDWEVPVQADHSDSAWDTTGSVRKLWLEDNDTRLCGTLRFVGGDAVARARDGRWKKLSIGIYLQPRLRLREVSVTPFPHLAGARMFTEEGATHMADTEKKAGAEGEGAKTEMVKCPKCGKEMPKGGPCPHEAEHKAEHKTEHRAEEDPAIACMREEFRQSQAQLEEMRRQAEEDHKILQQFREREDFRACKDLVEKFSKAGKTTAAFAEKELDFVRKLSPELRTEYDALKEAQPPLVEFGRKSTPHVQAPGDGASETEGKAKAQDLAKKY